MNTHAGVQNSHRCMALGILYSMAVTIIRPQLIDYSASHQVASHHAIIMPCGWVGITIISIAATTDIQTLERHPVLA